MRADAVRRRAALVREGRRLVAALGAGVALETVAEAADVGIATLYRNFASRAELLEEVAVAILADLESVTVDSRAALEQEGEEAWRAWGASLVGLDLGALYAALSEEFAPGISARVRQAQDRALGEVDGLFVAAQERGLVDPSTSLTPMELVVAVGVVTRPAPPAVAASIPELGIRLVSLLMDGLAPRPEGRPAS